MQKMSWFDRLRIERLVWMLDQRLYDLPRTTRIAHRREVRANLVAAAQDVGMSTAMRNVGNSSQLAADYLDAEFGTRPRHSWVAAALFALTAPLVFTSLLTEVALAFAGGITAADPHATATYIWHGVPYLQTAIHYTFVDGKETHVGGAWTPLSWAIWLAATIFVGRLWRAPSTWQRRRIAQARQPG
jgi:hypothetical protein